MDIINSYKNRSLFCYVFTLASLGNTLNANVDQTTDSDTDFIPTEILSSGTSGVTALLSKAGGSQYFSNPLQISLLGTGQNRPNFFVNTIWPRSTKYRVNFTNNSGGSVTNVEIQVWGYKVWN